MKPTSKRNTAFLEKALIVIVLVSLTGLLVWTVKGENPWFNKLGEQYSNQPMGGK